MTADAPIPFGDKQAAARARLEAERAAGHAEGLKAGQEAERILWERALQASRAAQDEEVARVRAAEHAAAEKRVQEIALHERRAVRMWSVLAGAVGGGILTLAGVGAIGAQQNRLAAEAVGFGATIGAAEADQRALEAQATGEPSNARPSNPDADQGYKKQAPGKWRQEAK